MGLFSSHANKIDDLSNELSDEGLMEATQRKTSSSRKPQPRVSSFKEKRIVAAYCSGHTVYEIAEANEIHRVTVSQVLKRAGVKMRRQPPEPEEVAEMARLYESGLSLVKVGDRLGFNATTVRANLRRAGIAMRGTNGQTC